MKALLKYITIFLFAVAINSCVDDAMLVSNKDTYIEFVARPASFTSYDVSSGPVTKAKESESSPTDLEKTMVSAYFLVFGDDGNRIGDVKTCTITDNQITPEKLWHNFDKGELTICYLVNVRKSYADSLDQISKFSNPDYAYKITYASFEDNRLGVPSLDGTACFPMIGLLEGVTPDSDTDSQKQVTIKRLFSKIYVQISRDTETSGGSLFTDQSFLLNNYTITNLPKYVLMDEPGTDEESHWVNNEHYFLDPIVIESGESTGTLTNIEFTFYVPEYALLPEADKVAEYKDESSNQKYKPLLFASDKFPLCLTIDGKVNAGNFVTVPLVYTIYLGESAFDSFSFMRNNQYNNYITIYGTGEAILGTDVRVEATYHNLADPDNTGTDNPANCYIIGRPGRYLIPTYKGNSSEMLGGIDVSKTVIYTDGNNSITNQQFFTDENGKNWVMFDVNMTITNNAITDLPEVTDGNTVLEFKDSSGNTVWSWHLWFTSDGILGSEWGTISSETYSGTNAVMMNRNIGAPGAGDIGMYYQWGDKDPYFTANGTAGYYGGVEVGDWSGTTKSVTDPCPPGYKVPSNSVWLSEEEWYTTTAGQTQIGSNFIYDFNNPYALYPYSGYIAESGTFVGETSEIVRSQTPEDELVTTYEIPSKGDVSTNITGHNVPRKYRNVIFQYELNVKTGSTHACNGYFLYGYSSTGLGNLLEILFSDQCTIISCERLIGTMTKGVHYTESTRWGITTRTYTGEEPVWGDNWSTVTSFGTIELPNLKNGIKTYLESLGTIDAASYKIETASDMSKGLQVRCVKE